MADAGEFIQIDDKTGADSRFFCTCFANQDETQLHGGVSDRSYLSGQLIGDRVLSASADASQGKGFAAAAGDMTIQLNDPTGSLLASLLNGSWQLVGGRVWIAYREPDGTMRKLYQLTVTDYASEDGTILVICKTPSYLQSQFLHKSAAVATLSTDAEDSANPTDPNYLVAGSQGVSAGMAFGGAPVSLKAGDSLPVCKIAFFQKAKFAQGSILAGEEARIVSSYGSRITRQTLYGAHDDGPEGSVKSIGALMFDLRGSASTFGGAIDHAEQTRILSEINSFIAAGYRIVISNGSWFLDILSNDGVSAQFYPAGPTYTSFPLITAGKSWGAFDYALGDGEGSLVESNVGIWFALANSALEETVPPDDLDATGISIYAVPSTIQVASQQIIFDGVAKSNKNLRFSGDLSFAGGISSFRPLTASDSGFVSSSLVNDLNLNFATDTPESPWIKRAAIEWKSGPGGWDDGWSGSGAIENIKTNPDAGWMSEDAPVEIHSMYTDGNPYMARIRCRNGSLAKDADFFCADSTWKASYTYYGNNSVGRYSLSVAGIFDPSPRVVESHTKGTEVVAGEFSAQNIADKKNKRVLWRSWSQDLKGLFRDSPYIHVTFDGSTSGFLRSAKLELMEVFVWAYYKFSFSSIYSTVYPFWTRGPCGSLAYGAGTIIAGGTGRGTAIQASGAITWAPFDLPVGQGETAVVTGTAYGVLGATPWWVSVGSIVSGATQTPACWLSDDDGVTWRRDTSYQTASLPTQVRFVNGRFVATRLDAHIDIASGFSMPNLIWSSVATGASDQLNDVAFGVDRYLMVGNAGQARYSSDLVTFSDWAYPAGDDLLCVAYSQSSIGGFFHVGYGTPSGGGTIFRKYDGSVTTWTPYSLPGGDSVVSIADCDGDVLAVSSSGTILARSPGYADVTWKQRLDLGIETYHDRFGILVFPLEGRNHIVVGGPAQIATSNTFNQGSSADYYGIGIPDWTPWGTKTPAHAMQFLEAQFMGGTADNWNPIQWQRAGYPITESFGLAVDPPSTSESNQSGTTALDAARQICEEWWIFSGDMATLYIDGSADNIEDPDQSDPTAIALGNIEDCFTQITAQYQPFGGDYLGKAYIQNVDVAYVAGNDAFYFAGWDDAGNAFGLALWEACRAAYLETGVIRGTSMNFDSIQSASSMGAALAMTSVYLGDRIDWICRRPKYYTVTIDGNESAAAQAHVGSFYKINPIFLAERGLALGGAYGTGLVVNESHNITTGKHTLEMAFKP